MANEDRKDWESALMNRIIKLINLCMQDKPDFDYRLINLLHHIYTFFSRIITSRLENKLDFYQSREQIGFYLSFGTNEHLQTVKLLMDKSLDNKPLTLAFEDFHKTFDTIKMNTIQNVSNAVLTTSIQIWYRAYTSQRFNDD